MRKILCLEGDGIGPEIMQAALKVLESISDKFNFKYELMHEAFGGAAIDKYGKPFPDEVKEKLKFADAVLMGAIGGPKWDGAEERPEKALLELRKYLEVYANVRPLKVNDKLLNLSPLKEEVIKGTDLVIVRELTGGAYFGEPKRLEDDFALDSITYTEKEIRRIAKYAFELAMKRTKRVCSVDKANVLDTSKLWRRLVIEMSKDYPEVDLEHMYVDAMAMALVKNPSRYDVILTENLFGDILSDEASVLAGSLGLLSSASYGEGGIAFYEPAHGSAPDIAGEGIANPVAMIYSLAMLLKYSFNEKEMADSIENAVNANLEEGYFTKDLSSDNYLSTAEWTDKLIEKLL